MKIRYSLSLLAILTNATFLCVLPTEVKAANNIVMKEEEKAELTQEEKEAIFENVQKELLNYSITLNPDNIIKDKVLNFSGKLNNKTTEEKQKIISNIFKLTWLKKLYLDYNNLESLTDKIGNLTNLEYITLSNNKLISLPDKIGNLTNLKKLFISSNQLTSLPDKIGNLINLEELFSGCNKLTSLPDTIGNLTNLTFLSLLANKLTFLPDSIGNLVNLKNLSLLRNELTFIPASIQNIQTLTELVLRSNPYLLPSSDNPLQWGKEQLRAHFRDRILLDEPRIIHMPDSTTKEEVYAALDENSLRINRDVFYCQQITRYSS
ncbi:MAG: leucine-rich repeat domain-containing protein [Alphaproteobacteria bacterium]|nr:leucine-rich repeat domain-containing protein [Alphaproteobacteria bacterium]